MRYPPSLLDEIRARLPVSQVVGRHVRLKRQGREYAGLSPFKHEKTKASKYLGMMVLSFAGCLGAAAGSGTLLLQGRTGGTNPDMPPTKKSVKRRGEGAAANGAF